MRRRLDFQEIKRRSLPLNVDLLRSWLPDGRLRGDEFIARNPRRNDRNPGSFRINIKTGLWADFALDDARGDLIDLVAYLGGCSKRQAAEVLLNILAHGESHVD